MSSTTEAPRVLLPTTADLAPDELAALALLVARARSRASGGLWDPAQIAAQMARLDLDPVTALTVALRAAADAGARTPTAITWDQYRYDLDEDRTVRLPVCDTCGRTQPQCTRAQRNTRSDAHQFRSRGAA